jgi:hypothetical protein
MTVQLDLCPAGSGVIFSPLQRSEAGRLEHFLVSVRAEGLEAQLRVWNSVYLPGPETLFVAMARDWSGWHGQKTWAALEGELQLIATADATGHVRLELRLQPEAGAGWRLTTEVALVAGELEALAARACAFFGPVIDPDDSENGPAAS